MPRVFSCASLVFLMMATLASAPAAQSRVEGALKVGDIAPDFSLEARGSGGSVSLSSFKGKSPVALVFGSYT